MTDWTTADSSAARQFFNSDTGQRLLSRIKSAVVPKDGNDLTQEAMEFRRYKGGIKVISLLEQHLEDYEPGSSMDLTFYPPQ